MTELHAQKFLRLDFLFLQATISDIFYSVFFCCIKKKKKKVLRLRQAVPAHNWKSGLVD